MDDMVLTRDSLDDILQRKYEPSLLEDSRSLAAKASQIPFDPSLKLQLEQVTPFSDVLYYRRLVGRLPYLTISRPNIAYAIQQLNLFMCKPMDVHYKATLKVLHYLKSSHAQDLHIPLLNPASVYCDNISAIYLAHSHFFHERSKHIEVDCHVIREKILKRLLHLLPIASADQLVDVFTKPLPPASFKAFVSKLDLCSLHHLT
ncbi:PREDICTED: uncharacterized protein LOC109337187 [Lupinus angustifolius]|uniref:uncharacterized protein LOC109337187 n=1 Tax=Lupinus angustifolius TaxID=3871 RepID=UPI00092EDBB6|nr:PREDICTED: uncharacterized protein LOC109337187 [Lupinus angustifolius]